MDERKRIKVLSRGPIECCGFIYGPILTPYMETLSKIFKMVSANVHVVEVLEDGTEVRLTVENLKKDNSVKPVEESKVEEPVVEPTVEEEIPTEEVTHEEVESTEKDCEPEAVEVVEDEVKLETIEPETTEEVAEEKIEIRKTDEAHNRNKNKFNNRR